MEQVEQRYVNSSSSDSNDGSPIGFKQETDRSRINCSRLNFCNYSSNSTDGDDYYVPYVERPETFIVPVIFFVIFIVGVLGNGSLIVIIIKHRMRSIANLYICSLSIGDLLVILFCVPFTSTLYTLESWPFGLVICKISEYIKDVSVGVSVFTLTALSADRYLAISDPMKKLSGRRATRVSLFTILGIWILSLTIAVPSGLFSFVKVIERPTTPLLFCYPFPEELGHNYPRIIVLFKFLVYYAIPLILIATFHIIMAWHLLLSTRNMPGEAQGQAKTIHARKKVMVMVLVFVLLFAVCFFPTHVFLLWFYFDPESEYNYGAAMHFFRIAGFCLGFINSCVNPISLYCISATYRQHFNQHLFCCLVSSRARSRGRHGRSQGFWMCDCLRRGQGGGGAYGVPSRHVLYSQSHSQSGANSTTGKSKYTWDSHSVVSQNQVMMCHSQSTGSATCPATTTSNTFEHKSPSNPQAPELNAFPVSPTKNICGSSNCGFPLMEHNASVHSNASADVDFMTTSFTTKHFNLPHSPPPLLVSSSGD